MTPTGDGRLSAAPLGGLAFAVLMGFCVVTCGPPPILDLDGRQITQPALIADVDGGWIAVDSGRSGLRAVLLLQIETPDRQLRDLHWRALTLQLGADRPLWPARLTYEEPRCWRPVPEWLDCGRLHRDEGPCVPGEVAPEERCVHVVRAEFDLWRFPSAADPAVLRVGSSISRLRWR